MNAVDSFITHDVSLARVWDATATGFALFQRLMITAFRHSFHSFAFCKPVFTKAGVVLQNKSSTAVSVKIQA